MQQILLNLILQRNTAIQGFQFFLFMGIAKLQAKMTCIIIRNIMKKFGLKFRSAKIIIYSNECAILCKTPFVLMMLKFKPQLKLGWFH